MLNSRNYLLRSVLALTGVGIIFLGLNVGLGGIQTLGWQGGTAPFIEAINPALYGVRDSHIRFIGGVWLGLGILMLAGSVFLYQLRMVLIAITAAISVGGLARLSGDLTLLVTPAVIPSFFLELTAIPLLGFWVFTATR